MITFAVLICKIKYLNVESIEKKKHPLLLIIVFEHFNNMIVCDLKHPSFLIIFFMNISKGNVVIIRLCVIKKHPPLLIIYL